MVPDFEKQTLRDRPFNKKITTFDIGTEQMLEFQNLFEITVFFFVNCVVVTFRWEIQPRRWIVLVSMPPTRTIGLW